MVYSKSAKISGHVHVCRDLASRLLRRQAFQIQAGDQILAVNGVGGNWEARTGWGCDVLPQDMLNVIQVAAAKPGDVLRLTVL